MILPIIEWPSPILQEKCTEVTITTGTVEIAKDMLETLESTSNGMGLAAPQVGYTLRIVVMKVKKPIILFNPKIVNRSKSIIVAMEGCLSFPGVRNFTKRSKWVSVEFLDETGKKTRRKFHDWESVCVQHEIDHLNGIIFLKR